MKLCRGCGTQKSEEEFNRRGKGLQQRCRSCQKAWYDTHKEQHLANVRTRRKRLKAENYLKVLEHLRHHPCIDCGEDDLLVLDFDHVRGIKLATIANLVKTGREWSVIQEEIDKCETRCANCHRRATALRAGNWRKTNPA